MTSLGWGRVPSDGSDPAVEELLGIVGLPERARVDLAAADVPDARDRAVMTVRHEPATGRVHSVLVAEHTAPGAPPLWFLELSEPEACVLMAFPAGPRPAGDLVDRDTFRTLGVPSSDQVAAIRWWTTGVVDQVYVHPDHRRRRIAVVVGHVAGAVGVVRGWGPLRGDGVRTDLGQEWVDAAPDYWAHRVDPRTETAPPMTPPG